MRNAYKALQILLSNYLMEEFEDGFTAKELDDISYLSFCFMRYISPKDHLCTKAGEYSSIIDTVVGLVDKNFSLAKIDKYISALLLYKNPSPKSWESDITFNPYQLRTDQVDKALYKEAVTFFNKLYKREKIAFKENHRDRKDKAVFDIPLSSVTTFAAILSVSIYISCLIFGNTLLSSFGLQGANHLGIQDYLGNFSWYVFWNCLFSIFLFGLSYYWGFLSRVERYLVVPDRILRREGTPLSIKLCFIFAIVASVLQMLLAEKIGDTQFNNSAILLSLLSFGYVLSKFSAYFKQGTHLFILILILSVSGVNSYLDAFNYHHKVVAHEIPSMKYTFIEHGNLITKEYIPLAASDTDIILYDLKLNKVVIQQRRLLFIITPSVVPISTYDNFVRSYINRKLFSVKKKLNKQPHQSEHS